MIRTVDHTILTIDTDHPGIRIMIVMGHLSQIVMHHHHRVMPMIATHLCHGNTILRIISSLAKNRFSDDPKGNYSPKDSSAYAHQASVPPGKL